MAAGTFTPLSQLIQNFAQKQINRITEDAGGRVDLGSPTSTKLGLLDTAKTLTQNQSTTIAKIHEALISACNFHQNGNALLMLGLTHSGARSAPKSMEALKAEPWYEALRELSIDDTRKALEIKKITVDTTTGTIHLPRATAAGGAGATAGTGETPDLEGPR